MADLLAEECNIWREHLVGSLQKVSNILTQNPPDLEALQEAYDEMLVDLQQLQALRPTSKKSTQNEYKEALPLISKALRIQPRVVRLLNRQTISTSQGVSHTPAAQRRIPELAIIPFEGDVTTYSSFIKSFHLKFDELPISPAEKLQHLKSNLRNDPFSIVGNLELTDENYTIALDCLQKKYDNKQMVISELYHKIHSLPHAQNTAASLRSVYYELEGYLTALKAHGQDVDLIPPLRDQVLCKYPLFITQQVCGTRIPNITEFQDCMSQYIQMRVGIQAAADATGTHQHQRRNQTDRVNTSKPLHAATASLVASSFPPQPEKYTEQAHDTNGKSNRITDTSSTLPSCVFCSEKHYSATCTKYTKLVDRLPFLKERCHRCLGKSHETSK